MVSHCQLGDDLANDITMDEMVYVTQKTVATFQPAAWYIPEDFLTYDHFVRIVKNLDWNSSPGYPYLLTHSNNRAFFEVDEHGNPSLSALSRVWDLVSNRLIDRSTDPIRLFIKPEPIKEQKARDYRYRLISSVSVIDQIIDHMLFDEMNTIMNSEWINLPSKVGWSLYNGGWKIIPAGKMFATDKKAWDWTVKQWIIECEFFVRESLCRNRSSSFFPLWKELATWRYEKLYFSAVFITSGGDLLQQLEPGIMKSGGVNTINTNSIMQYLLHCRVCYHLGEEPMPIMCMGDDTLQYPQKDMDTYQKIANQYCIMKECDRVTEFAGFRYNGLNIEPLYKAKHCFNLLHLDPAIASEIAMSYALLYHRSSTRVEMNRVLEELDVLPHPSFLDQIYDGQ